MPYVEPRTPSSYMINKIGKTFYDLVIDLKPEKIIEFGVHHGYSSLCMAAALKDLGKGKIEAYDLFEAVTPEHIQEKFDTAGLKNFVELRKADFWEWQPEPCDLFHLDINNHGEMLSKAIEKLAPFCKVIIFEGGHPDRDVVHWMKRDRRQPIVGSVKSHLINDNFPGLSIYEKN